MRALARDGARWTDAGKSRLAYIPLCGERLYLRNRVRQPPSREWVVDLLRDHVWGGEAITVLVRDVFYRDAWDLEPGHDGA